MALRCAARSAAPRGLTAAGLFVPARRLASKAEMAKSLEADQKALFAALDGIDPSNYAKVLASPELSGAREKVKGSPAWTIARVASAPSPSKKPVTVAVAGAGSAAGSEALFRIAAGLMLGGDQPVTLQLLGATDATVKELNDCAFPLLAGVTAASSPGALKGASYSILLEGDFAALGKALGGGLVAVSGCANAAIVAANAPTASVTAITRITQASAETQLAAKTGMPVESISRVSIWGEDAIDLSSATLGGKWALDVVGDWTPDASAPDAAVAADAIVSHMKDWALGSGGKWSSMGVPATGDYGLGSGFFYSVPVTCVPGEYKRVGGIPISPALATSMEAQRVALSA